MVKDGNHSIHNIIHLVIPLIITYVSLSTWPSLDKLDVLVMAFFGGLLPDVDHINIWFEYKFKDFKSFLKFLSKARRYRYSFLIFHNMGTVTIILLLIPIISSIEPLGGIFLTAFLAHLLLDFFDDKISIGRVTHWRYRRKT